MQELGREFDHLKPAGFHSNLDRWKEIVVKAREGREEAKYLLDVHGVEEERQVTTCEKQW